MHISILNILTMFKMIEFLFVSALVTLVLSQNPNILESPIVSNYGDWGNWDHCPSGQYVVGFQLETEPFQGEGILDDTALNAIRFFCGNPGEEASGGSDSITSSFGPFGDVGRIQSCSGVANGFQLRSEPEGNYDDTAANNLRVFCTGSENYVEGDGLTNGDWTAPQLCNPRQALCGIQTQVQPYQGPLPPPDDTTLNNLRAECCNVENPAGICDASDGLDFLTRCDNREGTTPIFCVYRFNVGLSYAVVDSASSAYESLGFSLAGAGGVLSLNYDDFGTSPVTGYDWSEAPAGTWVLEQAGQDTHEVAPGVMSEIYQVKGTCGIYAARTDTFREFQSRNGGSSFSRTFSNKNHKLI